MLASGKQAVIAGVHPGTRSPYAWSRALEGLDQIPVMSVDKFENFFNEVCPRSENPGLGARRGSAAARVCGVCAPACQFAKIPPGIRSERIRENRRSRGAPRRDPKPRCSAGRDA